MNSKTRLTIMISQRFIFSLMSLFLLVTQAADVPDTTTVKQSSSETMDKLEQKLELYRHERFLARIEKKDAAMSDFTTDGCSGGLSFAWEKIAAEFPEFAARHGKQPPWYECCVAHDKHYHVGSAGTMSASESFKRRKNADLNLKICVAETSVGRSKVLEDVYGLSESQVNGLYLTISELMYRAVRIGGIPCTNQSWRWGYGWPLCDSDAISH